MSTEWQALQRAVYVEQWIAEARSGSRAALEQLLEASFPYLLAVAERGLCTALRSRLDPVDVVQETLLKAWLNFLQFRGETEADFLAWLRQILRNTLANEHREHIQSAMRSIEREVRLVEAATMPRTKDGRRESTGRPTQALARYDALAMAMRRLPERYRRVLQLHTQEEMTFAQVGELLHCSADAARNLWRRAAERLTRLLGDPWQF